MTHPPSEEEVEEVEAVEVVEVVEMVEAHHWADQGGEDHREDHREDQAGHLLRRLALDLT